jgi:hypothetical protein
MRAQILKYSVIAILVILCSPGIAPGADEVSLPFDIDQWLGYSKREDFSWSVSVSKPYLTFQQRFVVGVRGQISGSRLPKSENGNDLHFLMEVASEDNAKVPGYAYDNVPVPPDIDEPYDVNFSSSVYLRPGGYTITLIVYDSVSGKGNVQRKQVKVSPLKNDELPELDRDFKDIEFVTQTSEIFQSGREWLPVGNNRCLCIDIVANVPLDRNQSNREEFGRHYSNPIYVLRAVSVLSHLGLQNGRIRVSLLDALQVKTVFNRKNADNIDWQDTDWDLSYRENSQTIDYGTIKAQTEASAYLLNLLNKIMKEDECTLKAKFPAKIVIVISGPMKFAKRTPVMQFNPGEVTQNGTPVYFFYFRMPNNLTLGSSDDDLDEMLDPVELQTYTVMDPRSFRTALATFISQLESLE